MNRRDFTFRSIVGSVAALLGFRPAAAVARVRHKTAEKIIYEEQGWLLRPAPADKINLDELRADILGE